jgi:hypothetical protein
MLNESSEPESSNESRRIKSARLHQPPVPEPIGVVVMGVNHASALQAKSEEAPQLMLTTRQDDEEYWFIATVGDASTPNASSTVYVFGELQSVLITLSAGHFIQQLILVLRRTRPPFGIEATRVTHIDQVVSHEDRHSLFAVNTPDQVHRIKVPHRPVDCGKAAFLRVLTLP